jgi:hypothetical protein
LSQLGDALRPLLELVLPNSLEQERNYAALHRERPRVMSFLSPRGGLRSAVFDARLILQVVFSHRH